MKTWFPPCLSLAVLATTPALAADPDALERFDGNVARGAVPLDGPLAVRLAPGVDLADLHDLDPRCAPDRRVVVEHVQPPERHAAEVRGLCTVRIVVEERVRRVGRWREGHP